MRKVILFATILFWAAAGFASAYTVPENDSNAKFLYVFGPQGNPYYGADDVDHQQVLFIDVPEDAAGDVYIQVYDPDTGGTRDLKPKPEEKWNTVTEFSVFGDRDAVLASKKFGEEPDYDRQYYTFGPFKKEAGKKVGKSYRFKFLADGIEGADQNLFNVKVSPESSETYGDKISFRLLPNEGDKMYFFVALPSGTSNVIIENYDLDPDGGSAAIADLLSANLYKVADSGSARWSGTTLSLPVSQSPRRIEYIITKKTQRYANAAIRAKDEKGNALPIYFRAGAPLAEVRPAPIVKAPDLKCNKFTFDATSSYDPNNEKLSYLWDFGDGSTSTEPVVTHIYEKGAEYTVILTVRDTSGLECDTSSSTQVVKVNMPPVPAFSGPVNICTGEEAAFDARATIDDTPETLTYAWDFDDGTRGEGKAVRKTYTKGGTYKVSLTVNDNAGTACSISEISKTVKVNSLPVADAGKDIDMCVSGSRDFNVTLDAGASRDPDADALTYTWDFGGGETATGKTVSHIYKNAGAYNVGLLVDDGKGSACSTASDSISLTLNRQPIANAGKDIITCVGESVKFDGSLSQGSGLAYIWDFGDGAKGSGVSSVHRYEKGGQYRAVLKADDEKGSRCSTSLSSVNVFVNSGPNAYMKDVSPACVGAAVSFDASGSKDADGDPLVYTWNFGDGIEIKGGPTISHAYAKGGTYRAQVIVSDKKNTACSVDLASTGVRINTPPVADAGPNLVCCVGKESIFDGSGSSDADGDSLDYYWNFGDGSGAEGARVAHSYSKSGTYTVSLKVDDNSGTSCSAATASFRAQVNEQPVSVIKVK